MSSHLPPSFESIASKSGIIATFDSSLIGTKTKPVAVVDVAPRQTAIKTSRAKTGSFLRPENAKAGLTKSMNGGSSTPKCFPPFVWTLVTRMPLLSGPTPWLPTTDVG
jgi:hypothetical protein